MQVSPIPKPTYKADMGLALARKGDRNHCFVVRICSWCPDAGLATAQAVQRTEGGRPSGMPIDPLGEFASQWRKASFILRGLWRAVGGGLTLCELVALFIGAASMGLAIFYLLSHWPTY